jgi:hypothetical protein
MYENQQYGLGPPGIAPQSLFGGMFGAPLGGLIGRGIGTVFGNPNLGGRIGEVAGGIGGGLLPFGADPTGAQAQQLQQLQQMQQLQQLQQLQRQQQLQQLQQQQAQMGQIAPQGFVGDLFTQYGKGAGDVLGNVTGNSTLGNIAGGVLSGLGGLLPFGADASGAGIQQQQHPAIQQLQQLQVQQQQLVQALQQIQQQQAVLQQQLAAEQQGGMAPQGWLGNAIKRVAQPVGGFIGSQLGNRGLGTTIGGIAGQIGGMLPFSADPWTSYAQQAQLGAQQTLH